MSVETPAAKDHSTPVQEGPAFPPPLRPTPPTPPAPPVAPPPKHRRLKAWQWVLIALGGLLLVGIIANAAGGGRTTTTPSGVTQSTQAPKASQAPAKQVTQAPTQAPAVTAPPAPSYAHFSDGTFQVGKDIQPGTYRTREASSGCYWARLKGFSGALDDILANDYTDSPAVVTIASSDKGFQSESCGTWTANLSQITQSKTTFGEGTFIVNTDLMPGTYKSSGSQGCYYARLRGFSGTLGDIIANNVTDNPAIVTISASDKGFQSHNCGTWTKQ